MADISSANVQYYHCFHTSESIHHSPVPKVSHPGSILNENEARDAGSRVSKLHPTRLENKENHQHYSLLMQILSNGLYTISSCAVSTQPPTEWNVMGVSGIAALSHQATSEEEIVFPSQVGLRLDGRIDGVHHGEPETNTTTELGNAPGGYSCWSLLDLVTYRRLLGATKSQNGMDTTAM